MIVGLNYDLCTYFVLLFSVNRSVFISVNCEVYNSKCQQKFKC